METLEIVLIFLLIVFLILLIVCFVILKPIQLDNNEALVYYYMLFMR